MYEIELLPFNHTESLMVNSYWLEILGENWFQCDQNGIQLRIKLEHVRAVNKGRTP